jgi:hypothetical protein
MTPTHSWIRAGATMLRTRSNATFTKGRVDQSFIFQHETA